MEQRKKELELVRFERVVELLRENFPGASTNSIRFLAKPLAEAPEEGVVLFHEGKKDGNHIAAIVRSMQDALLAIDNMSPWMKHRFHEALHREYMMSSPVRVAEDPVNLPWDVDQFRVLTLYALSSARRAKGYWDDGRPSHGKNVKAIATVSMARKVWQTLGGKCPKKRGLNPTTKFSKFLERLFEVLGVGAVPRSAYEAWYDYNSGPNNMLELRF